MNSIVINNPDELQAVSLKLIEWIGERRIIAFYGELGAGKTTLIKAICKVLGANDLVTSPSFSIINEYFTKTGERIYHFDFYRIRELNEIYDIGYEEYFFSGSYCFIEWPEKIEPLLPEETVKFFIEVKKNDSRIISRLE
jgi:tRNA threonylcarbamoyladenosine biosynthesis protein TsaE